MAQKHRSRNRSRTWRPRLERLEDRAQPAVFTVTTTADVVSPADDDVSLREAILAANNTPNADGVPDTIAFNIPGDGVHTINIPGSGLTQLPNVTEAVIIDGYTQPGASPNTNPIDQPSNASILIELVGPDDHRNGLQLVAGGNTVRGLAMSRFNIAVFATRGDNRIAGNYLGANAAGTTAIGNHFGVYIHQDSLTVPANNIVGGTNPADRNVIVGGTAVGSVGVFADFSETVFVQGNFIGTDATGAAAVGSLESAVRFNRVADSLIGGTDLQAANVIVGQTWGIELFDQSSGNTIQGNFIGTDRTGKTGLASGAKTSDGVFVGGGSTDNQIGGDSAGAGNVIACYGIGVNVGQGTSGHTIRGNSIGTDRTGTIDLGNSVAGIRLENPGTTDNRIGGTNPGEGNTIAFNGVGIHVASGAAGAILGNSIYGNAPTEAMPSGLGIDLTPGSGVIGPTPNDDGDSDSGGNSLQNFPVLTSATMQGNTTTIAGTLNSAANTTYRIEFFGSAVADESGSGEGQTYLGAVEVTTDAGGDAAFSAAVGLPPAGQINITATATRLEAPVDAGPLIPRETSEFSAAIAADEDNPTTPSITVDDISIPEGNAGFTDAVFTIRLSAASSKSVSVIAASAENTAVAGGDFESLNTLVTFAPGETVKQVAVRVNGDAAIEPDERFLLRLSDPVNATIGDEYGIGRIVNDDAPVVTASFDYADRVLRIEGTEAADQIRIVNNSGVVSVTGTLIRSANGAPVWTNVASIAAIDIGYIDVRAHGGNDFVQAVELNIAPAQAVRMSIHGQQGNDTLNGGSAADTLFGESGNDVLNGNGGDDVFEAGYGADNVNQEIAQLDREFNFYAVEKYDWENSGGRGEKWLYSDTPDSGYFILPNGELYKWDNTYQPAGADTPALVDEAKQFYNWADPDRNPAASGTLVATLDSSYFHNLVKLANANVLAGPPLVQDPLGPLAATLDRDLGLTIEGEEDLFGGQKERWLLDARVPWTNLLNEDNYYILPNGELYRWDGNWDALGGTLIATLNPSYYQDLTKLTDAQNLFGDPLDNDIVSGGNGNDTLIGGDGNDSLTGGNDFDSIVGGMGNDTLRGEAGNDELLGGDGDDSLYGGKNDDILDGGTGSDYMAGEAGRNVYTFAAAGSILPETDMVVETFALGRGVLDFSRLIASDPVTIDMASATNLARHFHRNVVLGIGGTVLGFVDAIGGAGNDVIRGNNRNNFLDGGAGNDTVDGMNGKDTIHGSDGDDRLSGGDQNDLIVGGIGNDWLDGGRADDFLFGQDGDDSLLGGDGLDNMYGEAGNDRLEGGFGRDNYFGGDGNDYCLEIGDTADYFDGGDGNDYLDEGIAGSVGNDTMRGGAGNDTIYGGLGNDSILGEDGNDVLVGQGGNDTCLGGNGNDRITGGATAGYTNQPDNDRLEGGFGDDWIDGGHNLDLFGNPAYRDSLYGNEGDDTIYAGKSREFLNGGPGNDALYGDDGIDTLSAGDGWEDILYPGRGNDNIFADSFDRVIDISEIESITPSVGNTPEALQPGTLVTIKGVNLPDAPRIQFGGYYKKPSAAAEATDVFVSPDHTTITCRVPRAAMSGNVWVIETVGKRDDMRLPDDKDPDDKWESAPGFFEVRSFRNTNGFSFKNEGFFVTLPIVQEAFGTDQTNVKIGGVVTPIPTPEALAFTALSALVFNDKGMCFGMALMSQHLAHHPDWINADIGLPFGSEPTVFNLTRDSRLVRFIERFHQHQLSQEMIAYTVAWKLASHTKSSIHDQIRDLLLAGDRPLISFQNELLDGHVVVAYDLEDATDTPETDDYYIHTYDPNRPYGVTTYTDTGVQVDTPTVNGQKIVDSRIYVGSNNLSDGNEWRFLANTTNDPTKKEFWTGGFGSLMVIPYGTVPTDPTFPGTIPTVADLPNLILGWSAGPERDVAVQPFHGALVTPTGLDAHRPAATTWRRSADSAAKTRDGDQFAKTGALPFATGEMTQAINIEFNGRGKKKENEPSYLDLFDNSGTSLIAKDRGIGTILIED